MKRFYAIVAAAIVSLSASVAASAQFNYGVIGGVTFTSSQPAEWKLTNDLQYHVGGTFRFMLPLGFAIQPEVLYHVKGTNIPSTSDAVKNFNYKVGFLEVPVSVQWGPDLLVMRPYIEAVPFFGYALNNKYKEDESTASVHNDWTGLKRWEYGLGLGAGIEIWHFQISARYNWNFGSMFDAKQEITDVNSFVSKMKDTVGNRNNFGGVTISLAVLF